MYCSAFQAIGQIGTTTIKENQRKGRKNQGEGDFVGGSLTDGSFDKGDHPVEERFARASRYANDYLDPRAPSCLPSRQNDRLPTHE